MAEQVEIDLIAQDHGTPAWKRQADAVHAYLRELANLDSAQKKNELSAKQWEKAVGNVGNRIAGTVATYVSLNALASAFIQSQQEQIRLADEAANKDDERVRKLRLQAGLGAIGTVQAKDAVYGLAEKNAFTSDQAFAASQQLVSSGFSAKEATGGSLDQFLQVLAGSNQTGKNVDAAGLAKALSAYLDSQSLDKNAGNVAEVGQKVQRLFKGTNLQLPDLPFLANEGTVLKGKLSTDEQLASFASLVDSKTSGATAAVGLRNFVSTLTGAGASGEKTGALKKLGLKTTDVDFTGENLDQVLGKLAGGLDKAKPEQRAQIMQKLFGQENAATAQALIDKRAKVQEYITTENDRAGFAEDVGVATSGRNAALIRQEVRRERRNAAKAGEGQLIRGAIEEQMDEQGLAPIQKDFRLKAFDTARYMGLSDKTAAKLTVGSDLYNPNTGLLNNQGTMDSVQNRVTQDKGPLGTLNDELKRLADETKKNTEQVAKQNAAQAQPKKFTPRSDPRPAAPRPSAAQGAN